MTLISSHDSNQRKQIEMAELTMLFYDSIDNSDGMCAMIFPRPISQCEATRNPTVSNILNVR